MARKQTDEEDPARLRLSVLCSATRAYYTVNNLLQKLMKKVNVNSLAKLQFFTLFLLLRFNQNIYQRQQYLSPLRHKQ